MNPACSPRELPRLTFSVCPPWSCRLPSLASPSPWAGLCPALPGTHRAPLAPRRPVLHTPSAGAARASSGRLTHLPKSGPRPCFSGFFQEMAPLQHPTACGRSPHHPQGGESPAAASAGSPSPAASRKREIPGKSGLSFSSSLGGFFQVSLKTEAVKQKTKAGARKFCPAW